MTSEPGKFSRWRWLSALPAVLAGVLAVAVQVGPDTATKNLKDWASILHFSWPSWLSATWFFVGIGILLATYYGILFRKQVRQLPARLGRAYRAFNEPPSAVPSAEPSVEHDAAYIAFEPGIVLFTGSIASKGGPSLEPGTWFAVFQRSRIANQATLIRHVTMSFSLRVLTEQQSHDWIEVPSSNVWFKRANDRYRNDLRLEGLEQETIDVAVALTASNQKALYGGYFSAKSPPDVEKPLEVKCIARDMAHGLERTFEWTR